MYELNMAPLLLYVPPLVKVTLLLIGFYCAC